jgi:hypothetical protein
MFAPKFLFVIYIPANLILYNQYYKNIGIIIYNTESIFYLVWSSILSTVNLTYVLDTIMSCLRTVIVAPF